MDRGSDGGRAVVLVGIDDSEPSRSALGWAAAQARETGARLVALHVRDVQQDQPLDTGQAWSGRLSFVDPAGTPDPAQRMVAMFAEIGPEPDWSVTTIDGSAGPELVRAAEGADLLVVGTHEHTGLARLVTGSVSHYCVTHTHIPVVAVPPPVEPPERD